MGMIIWLSIDKRYEIIYQSPPLTQHPWSPPLCFVLRTWTWTAWPDCRCNISPQPRLSARATPSPRAGPCSAEERVHDHKGEALQTHWPASEEPAVCADRTAWIRFGVSQWCKVAITINTWTSTQNSSQIPKCWKNILYTCILYS